MELELRQAGGAPDIKVRGTKRVQDTLREIYLRSFFFFFIWDDFYYNKIRTPTPWPPGGRFLGFFRYFLKILDGGQLEF
jgi:hypothetical protein